MITLKKGENVNLAKPAEIVATARWKDRPGGFFGGGEDLDYDLFCHVAYRNGEREIVKFDRLASKDGAIKHHGDLQSGGEEKVTVKLNNEIAAVGFSLYSARSNGTGSFAHAKAEVEFEVGAERVKIPTEDMSGSDTSYTLYFGTILNREDGRIEIRSAADFSRSSSEKQVVLKADGSHQMDAGPENQFK